MGFVVDESDSSDDLMATSMTKITGDEFLWRRSRQGQGLEADTLDARHIPCGSATMLHLTVLYLACLGITGFITT